MPVTRSASRAAQPTTTNPAPAANKRKTTDNDTPQPPKPKKTKPKFNQKSRISDLDTTIQSLPPAPPPGPAPALFPAELTFSFPDAKSHLIALDPRFQFLFDAVPCRPYEHLERVEPFRTLATSIIGQQISWLAARSILHKFLRVYDPSLPEKPKHHSSHTSPDAFFPTAHQVAQTDLALLRTAGLSGRKAEYIKSLATHFSASRLSAPVLFSAKTDAEVGELLLPVKGIGQWTVDMFSIFSLRRPDVLAAGDLGLQRGVLRWYLSLVDPSYKIAVHPSKLPKPEGEDEEEVKKDLGSAETSNVKAEGSQAKPTIPGDASSAPPAPSTPKKKGKKAVPPSPHLLIHTPKKPSTSDTPTSELISSLPAWATPKGLKEKLAGKKRKGALLTPQEMEQLTEGWRPYRSVALFYMWSLAEVDGEE